MRGVRFLCTATPPEAHKPGIFSRNPGVVLAGVVGTIGAYLYRSNQNDKQFRRLQNTIVNQSVIAPYEAYELRSGNDVNYEVFADVLKDLDTTFPSGTATFQSFDQYLGVKLKEQCPNGIKRGYHLERVLLNLKKDGGDAMSIDEMVTGTSMIVNGSVEERLLCLFGLMLRNDTTASETLSNATISRTQIAQLVSHLIRTCQVPSEKQVLPINNTYEDKFPFQKFTIESPNTLVDHAIAAKIKEKEMSEDHIDLFTFEEFSDLLKSKQICIWGECFSKRSKKRDKN